MLSICLQACSILKGVMGQPCSMQEEVCHAKVCQLQNFDSDLQR